jgi:hypothetical protein
MADFRLSCASGDGSEVVFERVSPTGFRVSIQGPQYQHDGEHPSIYLTNEQVEGIRGTNED